MWDEHGRGEDVESDGEQKSYCKFSAESLMDHSVRPEKKII